MITITIAEVELLIKDYNKHKLNKNILTKIMYIHKDVAFKTAALLQFPQFVFAYVPKPASVTMYL